MSLTSTSPDPKRSSLSRLRSLLSRRKHLHETTTNDKTTTSSNTPQDETSWSRKYESQDGRYSLTSEHTYSIHRFPSEINISNGRPSTQIRNDHSDYHGLRRPSKPHPLHELSQSQLAHFRKVSGPPLPPKSPRWRREKEEIMIEHETSNIWQKRSSSSKPRFDRQSLMNPPSNSRGSDERFHREAVKDDQGGERQDGKGKSPRRALSAKKIVEYSGSVDDMIRLLSLSESKITSTKVELRIVQPTTPNSENTSTPPSLPPRRPLPSAPNTNESDKKPVSGLSRFPPVSSFPTSSPLFKSQRVGHVSVSSDITLSKEGPSSSFNMPTSVGGTRSIYPYDVMKGRRKPVPTLHDSNIPSRTTQSVLVRPEKDIEKPNRSSIHSGQTAPLCLTPRKLPRPGQKQFPDNATRTDEDALSNPRKVEDKEKKLVQEQKSDKYEDAHMGKKYDQDDLEKSNDQDEVKEMFEEVMSAWYFGPPSTVKSEVSKSTKQRPSSTTYPPNVRPSISSPLSVKKYKNTSSTSETDLTSSPNVPISANRHLSSQRDVRSWDRDVPVTPKEVTDIDRKVRLVNVSETSPLTPLKDEDKYDISNHSSPYTPSPSKLPLPIRGLARPISLGQNYRFVDNIPTHSTRNDQDSRVVDHVKSEMANERDWLGNNESFSGVIMTGEKDEKLRHIERNEERRGWEMKDRLERKHHVVQTPPSFIPSGRYQPIRQSSPSPIHFSDMSPTPPYKPTTPLMSTDHFTKEKGKGKGKGDADSSLLLNKRIGHSSPLNMTKPIRHSSPLSLTKRTSSSIRMTSTDRSSLQLTPNRHSYPSFLTPDISSRTSGRSRFYEEESFTGSVSLRTSPYGMCTRNKGDITPVRNFQQVLNQPSQISSAELTQESRNMMAEARMKWGREK
ncbi:hypothetical protein TREMEDRAFT_63229 [Tremella mesenterica DSM 1558]|uniref:uncharacterized protein n=1 Tax=Tremella mesenterica (strain ATCC 24925 / CBS 8224 / DSM 1558 / NBRC 9311 / NRRL Y-6157 / RJB 2259-6 / UBC 559-6) TaxID=578456 RepID=UPI0003F48D87|nr:uncharacterized protein TREMEDRAFT_63229 [Tremella mesenterica DSM 1558]EIW68770.1 hypothetical protein TREMEDRAFT_63229 [Tremella mesenterica DSM 1558]